MNEALTSRSSNYVESSSLPRAVWAVIAAFFLVGTMVQFIVLLDFGPDEPAHLEYVYFLAAEQRLPTFMEAHVVQHPPLYYGAMGILWKLTGATQRPRGVPPGITSFDKYEQSAIMARRLMRLVSTLLGCLTLFLIARTLALLELSPKWLVFLVALAAASPMLQYVAGVVNNENLAIAYSALLCFAIVSRLKEGICTPRQALVLGLLCGGTTLIKQTTMFAVPLALWALWTAGGSERKRLWAPFVGGALATGVWWPLHNLIVTGQLFPSYTIPENQPTFATVLRDWNTVLLKWIRILLETAFLPDFSLYFVKESFETWIVFGSVAAIIFLFVRGLTQKENHLLRHLRTMSFAAMLLLFIGVLQYCIFKDQRAQIGGRYLLNSLSWFIVFLAACLPQRYYATGSEEENQSTALSASPGLISLILLGFLLVIDAAWWFIVWIHYQTAITTELQRRAGGG